MPSTARPTTATSSSTRSSTATPSAAPRGCRRSRPRRSCAWYVEAYDRTRGGRRTFKVAYIKDADLIDEPYEPRAEMADLDHSLGGDVGVARVWFSAGRARWELEGRPGTRPLEDGSAVA